MRVLVPVQPTGRLTDAWRKCVGTGRFELALRHDYHESLAMVQKEIGFRHIRGHGLLSDGVGVYQAYEYGGERHVRHAYTCGPAAHVPFGVYQKLAPASRLLEQFATPRQLLRGSGLL